MNDLIPKTVATFRSSPNLRDDEVFGALVKQGAPPGIAARIVEFLPMAYCRLILSRSGARFSDTFRRGLPDGGTQEKPLSSEPVWRAIVDFARAEVELGVSGRDLLLVAIHSAEFHAANQLLSAGSRLENLVFTSPVLMWPEGGPGTPDLQ